MVAFINLMFPEVYVLSELYCTSLSSRCVNSLSEQSLHNTQLPLSHVDNHTRRITADILPADSLHTQCLSHYIRFIGETRITRD